MSTNSRNEDSNPEAERSEDSWFESARDYVSHDQYLRRKFGDAAVQSIRKEIEGMVRLYEFTEGELDDDSLEVLFEQLVKEIDVLNDFENEVASVDVG